MSRTVIRNVLLVLLQLYYLSNVSFVMLTANNAPCLVIIVLNVNQIQQIISYMHQQELVFLHVPIILI